MRSGSHAETPSVFEVVQRAAAVCDPDGDDELIADFLLAHEDRDEPVTALDEAERHDIDGLVDALTADADRRRVPA